jgi:hypothetical protein
VIYGHHYRFLARRHRQRNENRLATSSKLSCRSTERCANNRC